MYELLPPIRCLPYVDFKSLKPTQGRVGSSRLKRLPTSGREGGPGGNGGCEWSARYFRRQVKPATTKADSNTAESNVHPASSIVRYPAVVAGA
jgi:hypothetical protein